MNKKIGFVVGLLITSMFFMASSSFAAMYDSGQGEIIIGSGGENYKVIGLSKGVIVRYNNPGGNTADAQWYTVSSAHSGGNTAYATAQNLTNIMKRDFTAGTDSATLIGYLESMPAVATSSQSWGNSWTTQ